jgi:opine dehydrogenase
VELTERVAVLGAGNGGCAIAADLARHGVQVTISDLPEFAAALEPLALRGGLRLTGVLGDHDVTVSVCRDVGEAVSTATLVIVAVPAFGHAAFARAVTPHLPTDAVVVLTPGATGGALEWTRCAADGGSDRRTVVAETLSLPYACRKVDPTTVHVSGAKRSLPLAAFPGRLTAAVVDRLNTLLPGGFRPAANVLETSLNNLNAIAHPVATLLNAGWIEFSRGDFGFYSEGVTRSVALAMDAADDERLSVVEALGLERVPASEWDRRLYGLAGDTTYEINQGSAVHRSFRAPASLETRYLTEDIPFGLAPIASIGHELGVPTPTIDLFVSLARLLVGERISTSARSAASLGLGGLTGAEMTAFVATGERA